MNRKHKDLSKNVVLFTISSFGSKLLTFLLVPLYTSYLTTEDYGFADLVSTTVTLALPILLVCVESGVLRFSFDKDKTIEEVFSSSSYILLRGTAICLVLAALVALIPNPPFDKIYILFFILMFIANGFSTFMACFYRGADRVGIMVESSLIHTALTCGLNILFLAVLGYGIHGYMVANFLGTYVSIIWGALRIKVWRYFAVSKIKKPIVKDIQKYCFPLIFNKLGWWINNSIDKYIVTFFLGTHSNGVYSVSYKIPTILSTLGGVFADAWALSAIKEFDPEDSDGFIIGMYNLYNSVLVIGCSVLIVLNIPLAMFLYKNEFFVAWKYTGPLLLSMVFGSLAGFLGCITAAVKDTKISAYSTITAGIVNIGISLLLVKPIGIMGVAIGTLVSNIVIWVMRLWRAKRHMKLRVNYARDFFMYGIITVQFIIGIFGEFNLVPVIIQAALMALLIVINRKAIVEVFKMAIGLINKKAN